MSNPNKITVLGVGAHPSDPFPLFGGTLAKHVKRGDNVILLSLTCGVNVHTESLVGKSVEEIKKIVREQNLKAAKVLGINDYRFLDFGDLPLVSTREKLLKLAQVIREARADIVVTHHPQEGGDHSEAAKMVVDACRLTRLLHGVETEAPPHSVKIIYHSLIGILSSLVSPSPPDVYVDVTDTLEQKTKAEITAWKFTPLSEKFADDERALHRHYAFSVGVQYAEPFQSVSMMRKEAVQYLTY